MLCWQQTLCMAWCLVKKWNIAWVPCRLRGALCHFGSSVLSQNLSQSLGRQMGPGTSFHKQTKQEEDMTVVFWCLLTADDGHRSHRTSGRKPHQVWDLVSKAQVERCVPAASTRPRSKAFLGSWHLQAALEAGAKKQRFVFHTFGMSSAVSTKCGELVTLFSVCLLLYLFTPSVCCFQRCALQRCHQWELATSPAWISAPAVTKSMTAPSPFDN